MKFKWNEIEYEYNYIKVKYNFSRIALITFDTNEVTILYYSSLS